MESLPKFAWLNGQYLPWADCNLHVRTQAVMMGGSVFEGVRAYWSEDTGQLFVFKLREHLERLHASARIMQMKLVPVDELEEVCISLLERNEFREDVHLVPTAYLGYGDGYLSLSKTRDEGLFVSAIARPGGKWLEVGKNVRISSWTRISDTSMPPRIKAAGNYQNSRLALLDAWRDGYDDAIMLNNRGTIAEAAGACLMMFRNGQICTPPVIAGILESVTRRVLIQLFHQYLGFEVVEREVDRTELFTADEVFLCGSGMEVVPVVSVDRIVIADGKKGPITSKIQKIYFDIARGINPDHPEWRSPVYRQTANACS